MEPIAVVSSVSCSDAVILMSRLGPGLLLYSYWLWHRPAGLSVVSDQLRHTYCRILTLVRVQRDHIYCVLDREGTVRKRPKVSLDLSPRSFPDSNLRSRY